MWYLNLVLLLVWVPSGAPLNPILDYWQLNQTLYLTVNKENEYILQYKNSSRIENIAKNPFRVQVSSEDADRLSPVMVVVRQKREVSSWEVPLKVDDRNGAIEYKDTARTLCTDRTSDNKTLMEALLRLDSAPIVLDDTPIISISTSSLTNVTVEVTVSYEDLFIIEPNVYYPVNMTPSLTRFYYYGFPDNSTTEDNMRTVVLEVTSDDNVCMIISIQNASCPVYDLNNNIKFEGYYETVSRKGGITISKSKFPQGFFVVFVPKVDDYDCTGISNLKSSNRNKTITYIIKPSIGHADYINAVIVTFVCMAAFCFVFGSSFYFCSNMAYIPRTMEYMGDTACNTPTTTVTEPDFMDNISMDETEYDTIAEAVFDREIILSKPVVYLSDLARKDFRILKKKSYSYLWHVLTVALFYGLPVIQLVITYQKVLNDTGNQDLCYYNFLCAHPNGFFSDFNHIFSNIGYVMLGFLFIFIVWRREKWHKDHNFDQHYGIPQHYGLFYAMGVALCMEGVLSGSYHICPNHSNFQFDTSFMYIMAVLCMVKIYQTRHPDINATAYTTFGVLAVAILLGMWGILEADIYFWIGFTILHVLTGFYLTAQIYYMGCWKLDWGLAGRFYRVLWFDFWAAPLNTITPKYTSRFVLLLIGNICNWTLAVFGLYHHERDFAMYLLGIFMMNTLLYFIFYITMKLLHSEKINLVALQFLIISFSCAGAAIYCFLNKSISWALTPAESRQFNQECKLMRFYDFHDIWHFLSAVGMFFIFLVLLLLDDDLSHTHRSKIHVF